MDKNGINLNKNKSNKNTYDGRDGSDGNDSNTCRASGAETRFCMMDVEQVSARGHRFVRVVHVLTCQSERKKK